MATVKEIKATARSRAGKGAARAVRREGRVPGVIYGDNQPPLNISLDHAELRQRIYAGKFLTSLYDVEVDGTKHRHSIAPNVVHSLDAAAMTLTICAGLQAGLTHFLVNHDCFYTHAADAATLARLTREQFVSMYQDCNIVAGLERDILTAASPDALSKLPKRPTIGSLELAGVLDSKYFFS